ncbi:MAG: hypothetical protein ACSHXI_13965 [Hoeflea sp.]|uniref:hypothetical protein n=1 Tax=Hoeflea sp. TaxID=1940281 RepID=UPI003EF2156F
MTRNKAGKRLRRRIATAVLVMACLVSSGIADTKPTYDKRIEEAAIRMLIPKLGNMRGSLDLKSVEYLRPLAGHRIIENKAVEAPAPRSRERSKGSFLFF